MAVRAGRLVWLGHLLDVQKVAGSNPVRPTTLTLENSFTLKARIVLCDLAMSGVESTREQKETQEHICTSCVTSVVQTFNHFQELIEQLKGEKEQLEDRLKRFEAEWARQRRALTKEIRVLEQKLSKLQNTS